MDTKGTFKEFAQHKLKKVLPQHIWLHPRMAVVASIMVIVASLMKLFGVYDIGRDTMKTMLEIALTAFFSTKVLEYLLRKLQ